MNHLPNEFNQLRDFPSPSTRPLNHSVPVRWSPHIDWVKMNIDAGRTATGGIDLGVLCRDHAGHALAAAGDFRSSSYLFWPPACC